MLVSILKLSLQSVTCRVQTQRLLDAAQAGAFNYLELAPGIALNGLHRALVGREQAKAEQGGNQRGYKALGHHGPRCASLQQKYLNGIVTRLSRLRTHLDNRNRVRNGITESASQSASREAGGWGCVTGPGTQIN